MCNYTSNVELIGVCDVNKIKFEYVDINTDKNWTEISIPDILHMPPQKLNVRSVDKIFVDIKIISTKVIPTHKTFSTNKEGRKATGRNLIVEGLLKQKIIYTALVEGESVHSVEYHTPFSTFIVLYEGKLEEKLTVDFCVEDVFVKVLNKRKIFINTIVFLRAKPIK